MAKDDKLIRNPKTGHFYSKFESMAKRADIAHQQHGLTSEERALIQHKATAKDDTPAVQSYLEPMHELIEDWKGNVGELRKIVASINEMNNLAQMHDPVLSAGEKRRIDSYAKELITFINRKTSLFLRAGRVLQNVARKHKTAVGEHLSQSPSAVFRSVGRLLSDKDRADKDVLKARSSLFNHVLNQQKSIAGHATQPKKSARKSAEPLRPWQADVDRPPTPEALGPVRKRKSGDDSLELGSTLDELLVVNRAILQQTMTTNQLLRTSDELSVRDREAHEREGQPIALLPGSTAVGKKQKNPQPASLFENLVSGVKNALGSLTKLILEPLGIYEALKLFKGGLGSILNTIPKPSGSTPTTPTASPSSGGFFSKAVTGLVNAVQVEAIGQVEGALISHFGEKFGMSKFWAEKSGKAASGNVTHGAAAGALVGSFFGGVGALPGAAVGATLGGMKELYDEGVSIDDIAKGFTPKRTETKAQLAQMNVSVAGVEALKKREGFRATPYMDGGSLAIGYGSHSINGESVDALVKKNPKFTISEPDASKNLRDRLTNEFVPVVRRSLKRPVSQNEFDSLVSIAYNRGIGRYTSDTKFLGKVNGGTVTAEDFKLAHGSKLAGRDLIGVESRRGQEFQQFSRGRDAKAIANLTAATRQPVSAPGGGGLVAPSIVVAQSKPSPPMFMPMPMKPENNQDSLRMVRGVNGI